MWRAGVLTWADNVVAVLAHHTGNGPRRGSGTSRYVDELGAFLVVNLPGKWPRSTTRTDPGTMVRSGNPTDLEAQRSWLAFVLWAELDSGKLDKNLGKDARAAVRAAKKAKATAGGTGTPTHAAVPQTDQGPTTKAPAAPAKQRECKKCGTTFDLPTGPGRKPESCPKCRGKK